MKKQYLEAFDKNRKRTGFLISASNVERRRRINSDYELTFTVPMTSQDYKEKILLKGHVQDERGQFYVINGRSRVRGGKALTAQIVCMHVMTKLTDFKIPYDQYVEEMYGVPVSVLLARITNATGGLFQFKIDDDFGLRDVKDWGRTTAMEALNALVELYGMEVEPDNYVIRLRKQIGEDKGHQYRLRKNIINDQFKDQATNLVTRMYATMKDGRTWIGQPATILTADERARLEAVPGAIVNGILKSNFLISQYAGAWASDDIKFFDGEMSDQDIEDPKELLEAARTELAKKEVPELEVQIDTADLHKLEGKAAPAGLGDIVYAYDPEMGLKNLKARVTELTEYPFAPDQHSKATVANFIRSDWNDIIADLDKAKNIINDMMSGGRIRADIFESFARQAVIDIDNSKTEISYPAEGGILAQEKTNPLNQVRLTAGGLGISTDGWKTIRSAVTARGVVAETVVGQFGNFVSMLIGSGEDVTRINNRGISAGASNFDTAPFRLNMKGDLVANSLTANYANIAYSNFTNGAITGSSINVGNGMFTVTSGGIMSATSGRFSGDIVASTVRGTDIEGGTVTGAILRTAAAGRRIEQSADGFRAYDSGNTARVRINTSTDSSIASLGFYGSGGGFAGELNSYQNGGLTIFSNDLFLGSNNTANPILLQGAATMAGPARFNSSVNFSGSVSGLRLNVEDINGLELRLQALWNAMNNKSDRGHSHSYTVPQHNHGNTANANFGGTYTTGAA